MHHVALLTITDILTLSTLELPESCPLIASIDSHQMIVTTKIAHISCQDALGGV